MSVLIFRQIGLARQHKYEYAHIHETIETNQRGVVGCCIRNSVDRAMENDCAIAG